MPLDTFKRAQLKISFLFLNQNICCGYSKNCLNDTVLWAPKLCYYLNQNICCGYSKVPSRWDGSFEHPKTNVTNWYFVCLTTRLYTERRLFITRYSLFITRYSLFITRYSPFITRYLLFITRYSLFITRYSPFITRYSLFITRYSLLTLLGSMQYLWPQRYHKGDIVILGLGFSKNIVFFTNRWSSLHWKRLNAFSPGAYSQRILGENKKLQTSTCFYTNRCQIFRVTFVRKVSVIARLKNNHCSWIGPFITCRYIEKKSSGLLPVGHNSAC